MQIPHSVVLVSSNNQYEYLMKKCPNDLNEKVLVVSPENIDFSWCIQQLKTGKRSRLNREPFQVKRKPTEVYRKPFKCYRSH